MAKFDPESDSKLVIKDWVTYRHINSQKGVQEMQEWMITFRLQTNIVKLMSILLSLQVSTASVERSFSAVILSKPGCEID